MQRFLNRAGRNIGVRALTRPGPPQASRGKTVSRRNFKSKNYKGGSSLFSVKDPFAKFMNVQLAYTEQLNLTAGALGVYGVTTVYRASSIFAPHFSGPGVAHQPYGRDTLATIYDKYKVRAVRLQIQFTNPSEDGMVIGVSYTAPGDSSNTLAGESVASAGEQFHVWQKALNNTGSQTVNYDRLFAMHNLLGVTKLQFDADQDLYSAQSGTSPVIFPALRIGAADVTATGGGTVQAIVKLTFYTLWFDRETLPQS